MAQEVILFLLSATPVLEVRAAVPLGIAVYQLPPVKVILICILGSILPVLPILIFLKYATEWVRKIKVFDQFLKWLFARTRSKSKIIQDFELVGLTLFVVIPFPGTGVWTGTIAAYLLGLPWIPTFICATIGTSRITAATT